MRIIPIGLVLTATLLACGRSGSGDASAPDSAVAPPPARRGDSVEVVARVGGVTLEHVWDLGHGRLKEARLTVHGRVLLVDEFSEGMSLVAYWPVGEARSLYLIGNNPGGTACDGELRVLELAPEARTYLSEPFGTCTWAPDSVWFDRSGALSMRFPDWAPFRVEMQEDYVPGPPQTYMYRGGGRVEPRRSGGR